MRNLMKTIAVLALLDGNAAAAQTMGTAIRSAESAAATTLKPEQDTRMVSSAPVGHRQPHMSDVLYESSDLEHLSAEDAAVDRKLIICRGC